MKRLRHRIALWLAPWLEPAPTVTVDSLTFTSSGTSGGITIDWSPE